MSHPSALFELSWEVCNKVGGIHTVLSTKATTAVERFGDDYVAVGPWLLSDRDRDVPFDEEPGYEEFCETCRSQGVPVRVGRWRIPGRPLTILVEFSRLLEHRDDLLKKLWDDFGVDSISGEWDYVEPVLFGLAAGMVIEVWWEDYLAPRHKRAIVQAHEWMTGSSLLYLKPRLPSIGTVFTTHATMLGRSLSSLGHSPSDGLRGQTPEELAEANHVVAKHSLEGVCAREADVFTTVSEITAAEAELLHGRRPDVLLPNGIDLGVIDAIAGPSPREAVRERLVGEAGRFLGEDVSDAALLCVSGRYEFHNKGVDVLLDALGELNRRDGRRLVLFVLVPAGNSGVRSELLERRELPIEQCAGPIGIATHNLFDEATDPVHERCEALGLDNALGSRVRVVQVPIYLRPGDGFLDEPYEAVLRAMDLTCFPSFYEPWGYTPQESLAVGVPTVTSDHAGFGRWVSEQGIDPSHGVTVLARSGKPYQTVVDGMVTVIEDFLATTPGARPRIEIDVCRETAGRTAWRDLFAHYERAYGAAHAKIQERLEAGVPQPRRAKRSLEVRDTMGPTPRLRHFDVKADLPAGLLDLQRLASNYWWCWDAEATALFAELDAVLWDACAHNPVALLQQLDHTVLVARAEDAPYRERVKATRRRMEAYLTHERKLELTDEEAAEAGWLSVEHPVAYFSAEFGIHESLPIYGGGLGVLAGDHVKAASDLGLPMVGLGLFYRHGYVHQRLTDTGEQTEIEREFDPHTMPLERVRSPEGGPLEVSIELPGRTLHLGAWRVRVGRVSLYLLDADTPSNLPEDRLITRRLYAGDAERRLLQEIVLGRGAQRLLRTLGVRPAVWHINEGHAAFFAVERVSRLMKEEGLTFGAAREIVRATTAFTTHTPVPAGHDRFSEDLMRRYFSDVEELGLPWERFFALGRSEDGQFNMTWLALSFASMVNGVSKLHGTASRALLKAFWPGLLEEEVPVHSVTNGIHLPTWTHPRIARVLKDDDDRSIRGEDFRDAEAADPAALWDARLALKRELVERSRKSLEASFLARSDSPVTLHRMLEGLDERALLIGFARRFAPYKRAHLLFHDIERLCKLLSSSKRPVRVLIAGKAHPRDEHGKDILKEIAGHTRSEDLIGKVFFLENYDMAVARSLVQGVDVWLNTPTRMLEASGTSGMKASANGALNLSIADGWWPEAYDGKNGWVIAGDRVYDEQGLQDAFDSTVLYRLLEEEIVPLYFDRNAQGVPQGWVERMVHNLATVPPTFDTGRMVREYFQTAYKPLGLNYFRYVKDRKALPKALAREAQRIRGGFGALKVLEARIDDLAEVRAGEPIQVRLDVDLGELSPQDVRVELVVGRAVGETLREPICLPLEATDAAELSNGTVRFRGTHRIERSGRYAHGLRIRAQHTDDPGGSLKDLVLWA